MPVHESCDGNWSKLSATKTFLSVIAAHLLPHGSARRSASGVAASTDSDVTARPRVSTRRAMNLCRRAAGELLEHDGARRAREERGSRFDAVHCCCPAGRDFRSPFLPEDRLDRLVVQGLQQLLGERHLAGLEGGDPRLALATDALVLVVVLQPAERRLQVVQGAAVVTQ